MNLSLREPHKNELREEDTRTIHFLLAISRLVGGFGPVSYTLQ
jgi:hypothetical protein